MELPPNDCELLSRFIIEPRDVPNIEYKLYTEAALNDVKQRLDNTFGISYNIEENKFDELQANVLEVLFLNIIILFRN